MLDGLMMADKNTMTSLSPNHTYFPIPSLYSSLPQEDVRTIEGILASDFVAPAPEAELKFAAMPNDVRLHPVVVIARSMNLLFLWEFRAAYVILHDFVSSNFGGSNPVPPVASLVRAFLAHADIMYNGRFESARACLVQLKGLLKPLRLDEYTDLMVYLLQEYLQLIKEARDASVAGAFHVDSYLSVIKFETLSGLPAVAQLRQRLQSEGRWREAVGLHNAEEELIESDEARIATQESIIKCLELAGDSPLLRYFKATKLAGSANRHDVNDRREKAISLLQQAQSFYPRKDGNYLPFRVVHLDLFEYRFSVPNYGDMDVDELLKFADRSRTIKFHRLEAVILFSASSALLAFRRSNRYPGQARADEIAQQEARVFNLLGQTESLYSSGLAHHGPVFRDRETCINWWSIFDANHHTYGAWKQLVSLQIQWQVKHMQSEDFMASLEAKQRAEEITKECYAFWQQADLEGDLTRSGSHQQSSKDPVESMERNAIYPRYFFEDRDLDIMIAMPETGLNYFGSLGGGTFTGVNQRPFKILLNWLSVDFQKGILLTSQAVVIFENRSPDEGREDWETFIGDLDAQRLMNIIYGKISQPVSYERWGNTFKALEMWIRSTDSFPYAQRQHMLMELLRARVTIIFLNAQRLMNTAGEKLIRSTDSSSSLQRQDMLMSSIVDRMSSKLQDSLLIQEYRRNIEFLSSLGDLEEVGIVGEPVRLFRLQCQVAFASAVRTSWTDEKNWTEAMESLFLEAISMLAAALTGKPIKKILSYHHAGALDLELDTYGMLYQEIGAMLVCKSDCHAPIHADQALTIFWLAELCGMRDRAPLNLQDGFQVRKDFLKALERPWVRDIFPMAIHFQTTLAWNGSTKLPTDLWCWIQHAKCRGLDAVGWYKDVNWQYNEAIPLQMAEATLTDAFSLLQLQTLAAKADQRILFVDYYTDFSWGKRGLPILVAYMSGMECPRLCKPKNAIDTSKLKDYKKHFLSALESDAYGESRDGRSSPEHCLQKFDFLIQPLLDFSKKGDIIVMSPCGLLHGLPLHAILVDNEPLICRNPVVYTTSMRSLWYSTLSRGSLNSLRNAPTNSLQGRVLCGTPFPAGQLSAQRVAQRLKCEPVLTCGSCTKEAFTKALSSDLDVVHYHAHSTFQPDDPLAQTLEFEDGPLSVKEYLDVVPSSKGHHITILGCNSGVTVQTMSNEPLGLVPALMHHGAASVVSALWPIDDKDAAGFSDTFYDTFNGQSSSSHNSADQTKSRERPLPPSSEMRQDADNRSYLVDHNNNRTTSIDPGPIAALLAEIPLPPGWEVRLTSNNRVHVVDHDTSTRTRDDPRESQDASQNTNQASISEPSDTHTQQESPPSSKVINLAIATQNAVLRLMRQPGSRSGDTPAEEETIRSEPAAPEDVRLNNDVRRAPLRSWAGFVLNGWWIMNGPLSEIPAADNVSS